MTGKIGFLGPQGTFSEEAALSYTQARSCRLQECTTIAAVFEGVDDFSLDEGIVPLENSLEGSVGVTMDILARQKGVFICKELIYPVRQCLMASSGTTVGEIKQVFSHPQALGQCRSFLATELPQALLGSLESTAAAAKHVVGRRGAAAIAPHRAAALFKLAVLAEHIEDNGNNVTRFVVVARHDHPHTGRDKTSLVLSIPDGPGSLYRILGFFARRNVNLTRIESRSARRSLGDWLFFIDCQGHHSEPHLAALWKELEQETAFLKLLGSYPKSDQ